MNSEFECDNCQLVSDNEDQFIYTDKGDNYCKECACCSQCRDIIKDLKGD